MPKPISSEMLAASSFFREFAELPRSSPGPQHAEPLMALPKIGRPTYGRRPLAFAKSRKRSKTRVFV